MYSPLIHFVPVDTLITLASLTSVPERQEGDVSGLQTLACLTHTFGKWTTQG
jgi:hypothetical protein